MCPRGAACLTCPHLVRVAQPGDDVYCRAWCTGDWRRPRTGCERPLGRHCSAPGLRGTFLSLNRVRTDCICLLRFLHECEYKTVCPDKVRPLSSLEAAKVPRCAPRAWTNSYSGYNRAPGSPRNSGGTCLQLIEGLTRRETNAVRTAPLAK